MLRAVVQGDMTKLLEKAIARARALPPEDQDPVGAVLLPMTEERSGIVPFDDKAPAAIRRGLEQARRGEFVPDADIEALWKRFDDLRFPLCGVAQPARRRLRRLFRRILSPNSRGRPCAMSPPWPTDGF